MSYASQPSRAVYISYVLPKPRKISRMHQMRVYVMPSPSMTESTRPSASSMALTNELSLGSAVTSPASKC